MKARTMDDFLDRVDVGEGDECWEWRGSMYRDGYGRWRAGGRSRAAHIVSWESVFGPVPEGLDLDHLCRNRGCVRPSHLEPVTRQVNLLRGRTIAAAHAAKTHCPKGHPYSEENTYRCRGIRQCRTCRAAVSRKRARARRGELRASEELFG